MSSQIFYFTGTGNSLKVAKDIAEKLENTKLTAIAKAINNELELSDDVIGLVFPVYAWGIPRIVNRFLKRLRTDKYVFVVLTHGGGPAKTMLRVKKVLESAGTKLSAGFDIHMPDNYIPMFDITAEDKQKLMFANERAKIEEIVEAIKHRKQQQPRIKKGIMNAILSGPVYKTSISNFYRMDKKFWTTEKCNSCEICYKICPVGNINMKEGKPLWKHDCEACMACIHWCPTKAIQYGKSSEKKGRYHHPDITLKEMIIR